MQIWLITADRRERIQWWKIITVGMALALLFGISLAMGVIGMLPTIASATMRKVNDTQSQIVQIKYENEQLMETVAKLSKDYSATVNNCGKVLRGMGGE